MISLSDLQKIYLNILKGNSNQIKAAFNYGFKDEIRNVLSTSPGCKVVHENKDGVWVI